MGVAATTYLGYKFQNAKGRRRGSGWHVKGKVYWTLDPASLQTVGWSTALETWSDQGYKIGFLLKRGQKIDRLRYGGRPLRRIRPQSKEVADLDATHGTPVNFEWHVWGGRGLRKQYTMISPNIIVFPVELSLSRGQAPQIIPVASRHLKGSFAQSMGGLWVLRPRRSAARRRGYAGRRRRRR